MWLMNIMNVIFRVFSRRLVVGIYESSLKNLGDRSNRDVEGIWIAMYQRQKGKIWRHHDAEKGDESFFIPARLRTDGTLPYQDQ